MAKFLLYGLSILSLLLTSEATVLTVGDSAGWDISADLPSWVANKLFYTGDVLLFQYSKYHTVNMVDREGFNNCNATNARLTAADGNTSVPLTSVGNNYFICGVLSHCLGGMKLQISVERRGGPASAGAPAAAPQSAGYYPYASPPSDQGTGTKNDNPSASSAFGVQYGARDSMVVTLLSIVGALILIVFVGI